MYAVHMGVLLGALARESVKEWEEGGRERKRGARGKKNTPFHLTRQDAGLQPDGARAAVAEDTQGVEVGVVVDLSGRC